MSLKRTAKIYKFPAPESARRMARIRKFRVEKPSAIDFVKSQNQNAALSVLIKKYFRNPLTTFKDE